MKTQNTTQETEYAGVSKITPIYIAECNAFGFMERGLYKDYLIKTEDEEFYGQVWDMDLTRAIQALHEWIRDIDNREFVIENPNAKYTLYMMDGSWNEKYGRPAEIKVYEITTAMALRTLLSYSQDQIVAERKAAKERRVKFEKEVYGEVRITKSHWSAVVKPWVEDCIAKAQINDEVAKLIIAFERSVNTVRTLIKYRGMKNASNSQARTNVDTLLWDLQTNFTDDWNKYCDQTHYSKDANTGDFMA